MQIELDPRSEVAIYQQLRDRIVEAIAAGRLAPAEQLASVRQVAVSFGINVATVSKAYDALRQDGFIRTNRKSGSVVARGPGEGEPDGRFLTAWRGRLATVLAEAVAQGVPDARVEEQCRVIIADFAGQRAGGAEKGKGTS